MQRRRWHVGIVLSAVTAACGSTSTGPEVVPVTTTADDSQSSATPTMTIAPVTTADASSAGSVAALAAAACDVLTSPAVIERYPALTGNPIDEVRPCSRVSEGESQLGTATTAGSGLVVLANFTIADSADQLTVVGLHLPSVWFMNGVTNPSDMRAAFPDEEVTAEQTAAGHEYLLRRSSEALQIDVDGLLLAFNHDENEQEDAPPSPTWPRLDTDGELPTSVRQLVDAIVDAIHGG